MKPSEESQLESRGSDGGVEASDENAVLDERRGATADAVDAVLEKPEGMHPALWEALQSPVAMEVMREGEFDFEDLGCGESLTDVREFDLGSDPLIENFVLLVEAIENEEKHLYKGQGDTLIRDLNRLMTLGKVARKSAKLLHIALKAYARTKLVEAADLIPGAPYDREVFRRKAVIWGIIRDIQAKGAFSSGRSILD